MPAPAVYVIAILGGAAAAVAFKQFVYEPHIHPRFQNWRTEFIARRRRQRGLVELDSTLGGYGDDDGDTELQSLYRSDQEMRDMQTGSSTGRVDEWRSGVDRSHPPGLRYRGTASALLPHAPLSPTGVLFNFDSEPATPALPVPAPAHAPAIRMAGPPSSVFSNSISQSSTLRPSDSASQAPSSPPQEAARSLSFAYDAQALHLSPPVIVPQLPSRPTSPFAPSLRFDSPSPSFGGLFVRPSQPRTNSNADTLGSDTPVSALGSDSAVTEHNVAARAYSPTFAPIGADNSRGRRLTSRSPSPGEDMFHSALRFASPTSPFSARALGSEFDFGEDTDEEIYEIGSDGNGSVGSGSWGSVSGVSLSGAL